MSAKSTGDEELTREKVSTGVFCLHWLRPLAAVVDYAEFAAEVNRLYDEGREKDVVLLADEFPDHYLRYARENDLLDEEEGEDE